MNTVPRLLETFTPKKYDLSIDLSRAKERIFTGSVSISGTLMPGKHEILLHSKDLTVESALVNGKQANFSHGEFDELKITHDSLKVGDHIVTITFSGKITDAMHGLYPCYFKHNGEEKELYATQFESHHAREVFPCIDEPSAKATYDVTLTTAKNLTVLGNMPIKWQREENDTLVTSFESTPIMSSYLLAWVVGEMHKKTATTKSGVEVNVWAAAHQDPSTLDFGLDIATRTIDFFDEYFDVKYPLPKCDNVALPDFSSGAMENWGLVTYRESCLLADPKITSVASKRMIATVITHELSHQWFGNLVTMSWWNDLWLNESFANMMEYVAVDALEPDWNIWEEFAVYEVTSALRRDSLDGVQSVQTEVNHPDEISALFDPSIVYAKGGRLLRMVRQLVGEEAFRSGLKQYFQDFAYQNTVGDDLWRALEKSSGKPILKIMNAWISQPGLPIVSLKKQGQTATLNQERFFIGDHQKSDSTWPIPLFSNQENLTEILQDRSTNFETSGDIQLNQQLGAHFVSHYDEESKRTLLQKATNNEIGTLDKICLLQDAPLLTRSGVDQSSSLLPLSMAFASEKNQKVFDMAAMNLAELRKFVEKDETAKSNLKRASIMLAKETLAELGWTERSTDTDDDRERRATAISLTLYGEDEAAIEKAREAVESTSIDNLPAELRPSLLSSSVRHFETPEMVEKLLEEYANTPSSDIQTDISIALSSTRSVETANRLLEEIKQGKIIRKQDASRWFIYLARNSELRKTAWNWLLNNWNWVEEAFSGDKSYDIFIRYAANSLVDSEELEQFVYFFEPMTEQPALKRTIELGIREISARVELIDKDRSGVIDELAKFANSASN